jgi:selenide,water dikinase
MAKASNVSLNITANSLPLFSHTLSSLEAGHLTKAHRSNEEYTREFTSFSVDTSPLMRLVMFDPQTSGGLLLCVDASHAKRILAQLSTAFPGTSIVGSVKAKSDNYLHVE